MILGNSKPHRKNSISNTGTKQHKWFNSKSVGKIYPSQYKTCLFWVSVFCDDFVNNTTF